MAWRSRPGSPTGRAGKKLTPRRGSPRRRVGHSAPKGQGDGHGQATGHRHSRHPSTRRTGRGLRMTSRMVIVSSSDRLSHSETTAPSQAHSGRDGSGTQEQLPPGSPAGHGTGSRPGRSPRPSRRGHPPELLMMATRASLPETAMSGDDVGVPDHPGHAIDSPRARPMASVTAASIPSGRRDHHRRTPARVPPRPGPPPGRSRHGRRRRARQRHHGGQDHHGQDHPGSSIDGPRAGPWRTTRSADLLEKKGSTWWRRRG